LLGLIVLINGYIIAAPLVPEINYQVQLHFSRSPLTGAQPDYSKIDRSQNHLVIPTMALDQPVLTGNNPKLVNKGIWHIPHTSTPDNGSNTVVAGHRYTYYGSAVFYNLDKVHKNDTMALVWDGKVYVYKVSDVSIVPPSDTAIEAPTPNNELTVYSCTPLWTATHRLVVTGSLRKIV
jgi:LPXTG-site transpeptidase (sortase) family protein